MYIRNAWYVAARSKEVGRTLMQRWLLDEPYVLYRTEDGRAVVMDDRCPHRRYALSRGNLKDDTVECAYHGLTFAADGTCVRVPGEKKIPRGVVAAWSRLFWSDCGRAWSLRQKVRVSAVVTRPRGRP